MPITNRKPMGPEPGTVAHFAASTAPAGWLKCNGAQVSRTAYAALFAAIGTTYGVGDGATTFNLPELRGEFLRALDDGRGIDTGRAIGSAQAGQMPSHGHTLRGFDNPGSANATPPYMAAGFSTHSLSNVSWTGTMDAAGGTSNASENRPRNVAMLACIKF